MAKRDHAKHGSRDHCFHCNEIIELVDLRPDRYSTALRWQHVEPVDPESPAYCPQEEILSENKWQPRTQATPRLWCSEHVATSWHYNLCCRPVTVPEFHMCGIHGSHERKRRQKEEEEKQRNEEQAYIGEVLAKTLEYLKEEYDLDGSAHRVTTNGYWFSQYSGKIVINPKQLVDLLDELRDMEAL